MNKGKVICNLLELSRYILLTLGVYFAENVTLSSGTRIIIFSQFAVIGIAGLTGIEGIWFGKYSSFIVGYTPDSRYQKQSAINNLALACSSIVGNVLEPSVMYHLALLITLIFFLAMSGTNHLLDTIKNHNYKFRNILRPVISVMFIVYSTHFILQIIKQPSNSLYINFTC